ncbi:MAG TPA: tRNA lysidine(34) synthetase TilS [Firmicutes bacterium]|nr:tRNA lysidine(34) synthetase TilS [Bacillota bacterium]
MPGAAGTCAAGIEKRGIKRMLARVRETIRKFDMLKRCDKIVVAVSGGPDSMALLHIMRNMQKEYKLQLYAAHVNHMLRGVEADEDAAFVANLCKAWEIPCFVTRINVPSIMAERKLSAEEAAREVRYHFLQHVAAITGSNKIAVGHNADDQAETILMRFLRGSGPGGLTGIPAVRSGIIRPLIEIFRVDIAQYCQEWGIETREDSSNKRLIYLRNRIRHNLIPHLESDYNNQLRKNLVTLGEILQGEESYWSEIVENELSRTVLWQEGTPYIQIEQFNALSKALQRRVLRAVFQRKEITGAGFVHVEEVRDLLVRGSVGAALHLPGNWRVIRHYAHVALEKEVPGEEEIINVPEPVLLKVPGTVRLPAAKLVAEITVGSGRCTGRPGDKVGLFDLEKLHSPLYVRTRKPGDKFFHTGTGHRKKLKEYFIDRKVPRAERDRILLITHGDDILWIVGYYADERYLAHNTTQKVLCIELREE